MCSLWQMRLQVEKQMIFAIAVAPDRLMVKRNRWCKIAVPHSAILMRFIIFQIVHSQTSTHIKISTTINGTIPFISFWGEFGRYIVLCTVAAAELEIKRMPALVPIKWHWFILQQLDWVGFSRAECLNNVISNWVTADGGQSNLTHDLDLPDNYISFCPC